MRANHDLSRPPRAKPHQKDRGGKSVTALDPLQRQPEGDRDGFEGHRLMQVMAVLHSDTW